MEEFQKDFKVIVIGDSSVGKTNLVHRYINGAKLEKT